MMTRVRPASLRLRATVDADARREQRVALVLPLVEQFVYDIGRLIAGHDVHLRAYVAEPAAARLRHALKPLQREEGSIRPEFGEYAQLRIEGDLLNTSAPVRCLVEFEDRSVRLDSSGAAVRRSRRRIRLLLILDPTISTVVDHRLEVAGCG